MASNMASSMTEGPIGGYQVEWFVSKPSEDLICLICLDVLNKPQQCKNGHLFCESCIKQALEAHQQCPTCKVALKESMLCSCLIARNMVEQLVVKCNTKEHLNCGWTGTLQEREKHLNTCELVKVDCPLFVSKCCESSCLKKYHRKDLADHIFVSKEKSVDRICFLTNNVETLTAENKSLKERHIDGYTTERKGGFIYCGQIDTSTTATIPPQQHGFGTRTHIDYPSTYSGQWSNGEMQGYGVLKVLGTVYYGQFSGGNKNGFGVMEVYNDIELKYCGDWSDDLRHGKGTMYFVNGDVYTGDFYRDVRDGTGLMRYKAGKVESYEGQWKDGEWSGKGEVVYRSGDRYEGQCKGGQLNGTGKLTTAKGSVYKGVFKNNFKNGKGSIKHLCGDKYDGEWRNDKHHGTGTFSANDGTVYTGAWFEGHHHGQGHLKYANGDIYDGYFHMGLRHGPGTLTSANGTKYVGPFVKGKKQGWGVQTFSSGTVYTGSFQNNLMHGTGVMKHLATGKVVQGEWKDGKKVELKGSRKIPSGSSTSAAGPSNSSSAPTTTTSTGTAPIGITTAATGAAASSGASSAAARRW